MNSRPFVLTGLFILLGLSACFGETRTGLYADQADTTSAVPVGPASTQASYTLPSDQQETTPAATAASVTTEYVLDIQDVLNVAVLQPDPLAVELTVAPDGTITFPYIGTVPVRGLTLMQVQDKIQTGLMDYMKYPVVSVSLKESKSLTFFVFGEVQRPGSYVLEKDMTVLKAITTAGGFTRIASTNDVKVVRQLSDGTTSALTVDVNALMTGQATKDEKIERGDIITVSKSFF